MLTYHKRADTLIQLSVFHSL